MKITHHIRLSQADAHYGGDLVDGAKVLALFGDVATELLIRLMAMKGCLEPMKVLIFSSTFCG